MPAGAYTLAEKIQITTERSRLFGPGRVTRTNPAPPTAGDAEPGEANVDGGSVIANNILHPGTRGFCNLPMPL